MRLASSAPLDLLDAAGEQEEFHQGKLISFSTALWGRKSCFGTGSCANSEVFGSYVDFPPAPLLHPRGRSGFKIQQAVYASRMGETRMARHE